MTDADKIAELKKILDPCDDTDATLLSYLAQAKAVILNRMYPYMNETEYAETDLPEKFDWKQIRIAAYFLNKRGAEGEVQHIENGIHRNYKASDVPEDMLWDVFPQVGIPR